MYTYMQNFPAFYSPYASPFLGAFLPIIAVVALWTIVIKGYALWTAARSGQKWWFIALLVINTIGILEIVYLIWFSPKGSNKLSSLRRYSSADKSSPQA